MQIIELHEIIEINDGLLQRAGFEICNQVSAAVFPGSCKDRAAQIKELKKS